MEEQWINDLRKKMADHHTPVPPGLWEDIEAALPTAAPEIRPRRRSWVWWAAGVGSAAATVAIAWFLTFPTSDSLQTTVAEKIPAASFITNLNKQTTRQKLYQSPAGEQGEWIAEAAPVQRDNLKGKPVDALRAEDGSSRSQALREVGEAETDGLPASDSQQAEEKENLPEKRVGGSDAPQPALMRGTSPKLADASLSGKKKKRKSLAVNLYAANLTHTSSHQGGYGEFVTGDVLPHEVSGHLWERQEPAKDIIYNNLGKEVDTYKKHKLPVKFGLSLRIPLSRRWSVETGLTYTYLSSELISGSDQNHYVTQQRLQYLGVPFHVSYQLADHRLWQLYATAGGSLEKCIYGKSATDYIINQNHRAMYERRFFEQPLQASVDGALGAQLNFGPHVGLYAEPGVCYYFNNGSAVQTIYKDKPLNFNFKLGFRFSL